MTEKAFVESVPISLSHYTWKALFPLVLKHILNKIAAATKIDLSCPELCSICIEG